MISICIGRYGGWSTALLNKSEVEYFSGTTDNFIVWFNNKGYHAIPAYTNSIHNSMLRAIASQQPNVSLSSYGISTWVEPIKLEGHQVWDQSV